MNQVPPRFNTLIVEGYTPEQAGSEARLEGFDIQAGAYLQLISDVPTFQCYLAYLRLLVRGELAKVARRVDYYQKPDGTLDDFWNYLKSSHLKSTQTIYDPLGGEIVWFELGISERARAWKAKAFRRAADLKLALIPSSEAAILERSSPTSGDNHSDIKSAVSVEPSSSRLAFATELDTETNSPDGAPEEAPAGAPEEAPAGAPQEAPAQIGITDSTEVRGTAGQLLDRLTERQTFSTRDPTNREAAKDRALRKGDVSLLQDKRLVSFATAEMYLGVTSRQRQTLVRRETLVIQGKGQNRKITVESPPSIPP